MRPRLPASAALAAALALSSAAAAQTGTAPLGPALRAAGEPEEYLRTLQALGDVPLHPWSVRAFSPREGRLLTPTGEHPWRTRYGAAGDPEPRAAAVPLELRSVFNSAFPFGTGDGPVWAGRGVTAAVHGGVRVRAGAVTVQVAPTAFLAENRAFPLRETDTLASRFGNPRGPRRIDLPQRFGDGPVGRLDPGESFLRLDAGRISMGISSAVQQWGPASRQPLLLGADGPGLPHLFVGTAAPVNVGIGRLHGRIIWGEARHSRFAPPREGLASRRFVSGAVAVFTPAFAPGLEVGGARFFHLPWPAGGPGAREALRIFDPFAKSALDDTDGTGSRDQPDNQLASVFARWVLPSIGLEVYGEFGREDHNWDLLDFYLEPDHHAAYLLGARRSWRGRGAALWTARAELLSSRVSHLAEVRGQPRFHEHTWLPQGHTHRGQPLGAAAAHGGGGAVFGVDRYSPGGRVTAEWVHARVDERWRYHLTGERAERDTDVLHGVFVEGTRFLGRVDLNAGVGGMLNLNRHFRADVFNLNLRLGARVSP